MLRIRINILLRKEIKSMVVFENDVIYKDEVKASRPPTLYLTSFIKPPLISLNKNILFSSLFCDLSFARNYFCALKIMWRIFMFSTWGRAREGEIESSTMLLEVVIFNGTIGIYTHSISNIHRFLEKHFSLPFYHTNWIRNGILSSLLSARRSGKKRKKAQENLSKEHRNCFYRFIIIEINLFYENKREEWI